MKTFVKIKRYFDQNFSHNKNFEYFYNMGVDSYGRQDYEKAINLFKQAIECKDIKPQVYYNIGLSYQCTKEYDKAIVNYLKFLEAKPEDYDGLYNLALTYFTKEKFKKAIEYFEKCALVKQDEDVVKALVLAYLSANEFENALNFADRILETSPYGKDLYYAAAKVFENKNSLNKDFTYIDAAIGMYIKIIERDSKYFNAYLSTSICYAKKGEWDNSVSYCQKALEANPKSYEANNQMGLVYYCCDNIKESIKYYETALNLKPHGDFKIYSNLGYAYEKIGQYDKAIKVFTQLISKFPQFPAKNEIKNHLRILKEI